MNHLKVKLLHPDAKSPTVAHPGEDIAYDLYSCEDVGPVYYDGPVKIRTGVAVAAYRGDERLGLLLRTRSGMASDGFSVEGGVIDSRYTGELIVILKGRSAFSIKKGDKIAQAIPVEVLTGAVIVTDELEAGTRGDRGFGSSGR